MGLWATRIKRNGMTLWFARKHPDTPLRAKVVGVMALVYALSPIDVVPDFIPILGYIDDALLLPAIIWLALRLLPPQVLALCQKRADDWIGGRGFKLKNYIFAFVVLAIWSLIVYLCWHWIYV